MNLLLNLVNITVLTSVVYAGTPVYTGPGLETGIDDTNPTPSSNISLFELILNFIDFILSLIGIIAVAAVIIAGIYLIVGGVSEDNRKRARDIIVYVIIGLLVIIFAKVIIGFVLSVFN